MRLPAHREEPSVRYVAASLVAGVFFGGVAGGVAFPTLPRLGPLLGISPFLVGVILSVNRFTRLLLNTPAGSILDRMGTRRPMIGGFLVMSLAPFGYVVGMHPEAVPGSAAGIFLVSRAAWGVGSAFVFVGAFSTITHVTTTDNRGKWIGYMRGGQTMGFPTGLVVGGVVADAAGITEAFVLAGAAGMLSTLVAAAVLPNLAAEVNRTAPLRELPALVSRDRRVLAVGTVNLVVRFLFAGVLLSTVVLYADRNAIAIGGLSESGVSGVVMAVSVVASSVTTVVAGRISDSLPNRALVPVPALASLAVGFAAVATVPTLVGTLVGVSLIGVGVGGTNPPLLAYLGDISPAEDVGKLGGAYNVFGDVGSTAGPLIALPVAYRIGFGTQYLLCAVLVVLTGVLVASTLVGASPEPNPQLAD
ncbi:MAG: MFS transporter [Halobacteriales archaeon]